MLQTLTNKNIALISLGLLVANSVLYYRVVEPTALEASLRLLYIAGPLFSVLIGSVAAVFMDRAQPYGSRLLRGSLFATLVIYAMLLTNALSKSTA